MKNLLLAFCAWSLLGCKKSDPAPVAVPFDQEYAYAFERQVYLSDVASPELRVTIADLRYSICPSKANCLAPDYVLPTLSIADAAGQVQRVTLPLPGHQRPANAAWMDTATVQANGRHYLFYYTKYYTAGKRDNVQKTDIAVTLRVVKR